MTIDIAVPVGQDSVLVVGDNVVGKTCLLNSLTSFPQDDHGISIYLNTRYYTARVALSEQHAATAPTGLEDYEAVIFVVDITRRSSFEQIIRWINTHKVDLSRFGVRLCVGNKYDLLGGPSEEIDYPRWVPKLKQWCADEYVEYIDAISHQPPGKLLVGGELQGIERVRQALAAHTWPSMVMKSAAERAAYQLPVDTYRLLQEYADSSDGGGTRTANAESSAFATHAKQAHYERQQEGSVGGSCPQDDAVQGPAMTAERSGGGASPRAYVAIDGEAVFAEEADWSQFQGPSEDAFDLLDEREKEFDKLLTVAKGARERFASLPDDQRRAAAGDLVLKMMSMIDLEDEDVGSPS